MPPVCSKASKRRRRAAASEEIESRWFQHGVRGLQPANSMLERIKERLELSLAGKSNGRPSKSRTCNIIRPTIGGTRDLRREPANAKLAKKLDNRCSDRCRDRRVYSGRHDAKPGNSSKRRTDRSVAHRRQTRIQRHLGSQ